MAPKKCGESGGGGGWTGRVGGKIFLEIGEAHRTPPPAFRFKTAAQSCSRSDWAPKRRQINQKAEKSESDLIGGKTCGDRPCSSPPRSSFSAFWPNETNTTDEYCGLGEIEADRCIRGSFYRFTLFSGMRSTILTEFRSEDLFDTVGGI